MSAKTDTTMANPLEDQSYALSNMKLFRGLAASLTILCSKEHGIIQKLARNRINIVSYKIGQLNINSNMT